MQTAEKNITGIFDLDAVRKDFPLLSRDMNGKPLVFLDSAASSQKPSVVIDAISHYYKYEHANVHRGVYAISAAATDAFEASREAAKTFLNAASSREVIFTRGTTESINLVASGFERDILKPGDEVLITAMEHHSNIVPWQIACSQTGATIKAIPVNDKGELILDNLDSLLTERTRIVALVHISNTLGTINPVKEIISKAHQNGIPVLLDGAQATPHMKIDVQALDVDFYACSGHKMYGPTGIGILYGKEKWLDRLPPYQGGGEMIKEVTLEKTEFNDLPFKFEAGTPNIAGVIGLHKAMDYMTALPWDEVYAHEQALLEHATELLGQIDGIKFVGTALNKASVLSYNVNGVHPHDLGTLLDQQGIAVRTGHHCTEPLMTRYGIPGTVRASFSFYNTHEEVERLYRATAKAVRMLS
jgi:cysteine desulfurase / selenocysteine lyase